MLSRTSSLCIRRLSCWIAKCREWKGQVAAAVQRMYLQTNILAFSAYDDEAYVRGMLEAGAVGYLLKDETPERIIEAVRAVADGNGWFSPAIVAELATWVRREQQESPKLTSRESAVLRLLAKGKPNDCIAEELSIAERTVRFHLRNIYDKIGVHSRTKAVIWAIQHRLTGKE